MCDIIFENIEVVLQRCSTKKVFWEISQSSEENACVSYLIKLNKIQYCEFCESSKNTFLHRTPVVAASENTKGIYSEATV